MLLFIQNAAQLLPLRRTAIQYEYLCQIHCLYAAEDNVNCDI